VIIASTERRRVASVLCVTGKGETDGMVILLVAIVALCVLSAALLFARK
jgi:hypothetical protein